MIDHEPALSDRTAKALKKGEASNAAREELDELAKKLKELEGAKVSVPKGQKRSAEAKAKEKKRKQTEKELKKSISPCQMRIKAFKDADAKVVARCEAAAAQHRAVRELLAAVGNQGSLSPDALLTLRNRQD